MSILCIVVKEAHINGSDSNFNTYVVVKIGAVKSTTLAKTGIKPCWNEEFFFEINEQDDGLTVELWNRGMLWDKLLGVHWLRLINIKHSDLPDDDSNDIRISLDSELCLKDEQVVGTQFPTGHYLLLNARIEQTPTADLNESESVEFQQKVELLNEILEKEGLSLENDLDSLLQFKNTTNLAAISNTLRDYLSSIVDSGNETLTGGLNTNNQSQINKHASFDLANSSAKYEDDYEQMSNNDQSKRFSQSEELSRN